MRARGLGAVGHHWHRDVIRLFNAMGLAALDPRWAGGRPRLISDEDTQVIVTAATTRPEKLGLPFTHWSLRKLAAHLAGGAPRRVQAGRERLRQILHAHGISFQRTRTWKESADTDRDAKLDRIEHVITTMADRCYAFDQFGPMSIRPVHGSSWAPRRKLARLRVTYRCTQGIRYFHGCYALGTDQIWGITREHEGAGHTLAALKSIRATRPDGYRLARVVSLFGHPRRIEVSVGTQDCRRRLDAPDTLTCRACFLVSDHAGVGPRVARVEDRGA